MAVTADAEHAGRQMSAFRQHNMADPLLVIEIGDLLVPDPLAGQRLDGAGLFGIGRNIVIGDHNHPVPVPDAAPEPLQHRLHPARAAGIMDHRQIDLADDDIACRDAGLPGGAGDQFSGKSFHEKTVA